MNAESDQRHAEKAARFRELHEAGTFVIPNPWDAGSARVLEGLGFEALATTSGGFAYTLGRADGEVTLEEALAHTRLLDRASSLPVAVDLEDGYGAAPEQAAAAITAAAGAGAVGGSIEDYSAAGGIHERGAAVERIVAAVEAARALPHPFTLTARADNFVRGNPDLDDTIERLVAFERVGADVLYAPRLRSIEEVRAVCDAVSKPLNVLARRGLTVAELREAGVRRISLGSTLAWTAVSSFVEAARMIRDEGSFAGITPPPAELDEWLEGPGSQRS